MATDAAKVRRFEDGLKLSIGGKIIGHNLQDMDSMANTALIIEREIENARSICDAKASGKRKKDQPFSSLGKRQRTYVPRVPQLQGQLGSMTCFYCHQPGHMNRDCQWRQGSQGFGLTQSQSSVGQARTQFIPSHPSVGQRNQFQSQSVMPAPPAIQMGQRGQVMGRGQV